MGKRLLLADKLFEELDYGKRVTIRKGRRDIGLDYMIFERVSDGAEKLVDVNRVYITKLKDVLEEDYKNDGFNDVEDMLHQMKEFYPDITVNSLVSVIKFEPVSLSKNK